MWNGFTPEMEGVTIAAIFIALSAFASWRLRKGPANKSASRSASDPSPTAR
jgi:hypothetical protein